MNGEETSGVEYTARLQRLEGGLIKRIATPVNPYRWNIRRLAKGRVLDVGCGIGRNLRYLGRSEALGVDHNQASVEVVKTLGYKAQTLEEFEEVKESHCDAFDSILISHVLEHLSISQARDLVTYYLPSLKNGGEVVVICPQERGYASDSTHVTYFSISDLELLLDELGLRKVRSKSFPLPKTFGKLFIYNENIVVYVKSEE